MSEVNTYVLAFVASVGAPIGLALMGAFLWYVANRRRRPTVVYATPGAAPSAPAPTVTTTVATTATPSSGSKMMRWLVVGALLIVLALAAFWVFRSVFVGAPPEPGEAPPSPGIDFEDMFAAFMLNPLSIWSVTVFIILASIIGLIWGKVAGGRGFLAFLLALAIPVVTVLIFENRDTIYEEGWSGLLTWESSEQPAETEVKTLTKRDQSVVKTARAGTFVGACKQNSRSERLALRFYLTDAEEGVEWNMRVVDIGTRLDEVYTLKPVGGKYQPFLNGQPMGLPRSVDCVAFEPINVDSTWSGLVKVVAVEATGTSQMF